MYKSASKNMQRSIGRDLSRRPRLLDPKTKRQNRRFWFPVIDGLYSDTHLLNELDSSYFDELEKTSMPDWLKYEIRASGYQNWIDKWLKQASPMVRKNIRRKQKKLKR